MNKAVWFEKMECQLYRCPNHHKGNDLFYFIFVLLLVYGEDHINTEYCNTPEMKQQMQQEKMCYFDMNDFFPNELSYVEQNRSC